MVCLITSTLTIFLSGRVLKKVTEEEQQEEKSGGRSLYRSYTCVSVGGIINHLSAPLTLNLPVKARRSSALSDPPLATWAGK